MEVRNGQFKDESVPPMMKHESTLAQDADNSLQRCSLVFLGLLYSHQPWFGHACSHHLPSIADVRKKVGLEKSAFVPEDFESYIYYDSFIILLVIQSVLCDLIL